MPTTTTISSPSGRIESIASDTIADPSVQLAFGLVGFRLYLADGVTTATVKISFDTQVSDDAELYKYTTDNGWQTYDNAVFAADGKSATLLLEDGKGKNNHVY